MTKRVVVRGIGRAPEPLLRALEDCGVLVAAEGGERAGEDASAEAGDVVLYVSVSHEDLERVASGVMDGGGPRPAAPFLVYAAEAVPPDLLDALATEGLVGVIEPGTPVEEVSYLVNRALFHAMASGRNPRVPVDLPVVARSATRTIETSVSMLSRDGAYVNTLSPMENGTDCELTIDLPDGGPPVSIQGRVLYGAGVNRDISIISSADEPFRRLVSHPGMAVLFTGVGADDAARIEALVRSMA